MSKEKENGRSTLFKIMLTPDPFLRELNRCPSLSFFQAGVSLSEMDKLMCDEDLGRKSPEVWPEPIPGLNAFAAERLRNGEESTVPPWLEDLGENEIDLLQSFANKTPRELMDEMRKLLNLAYHLGLEEAKETARGKYLRVLEKQEGPSK